MNAPKQVVRHGTDIKPAIALVGRPNVGKSTLFNRLTASHDALVHDQPGVTRDRLYGIGCHRDREFLVVDTGGLRHDPSPLQKLVDSQVQHVLSECAVIVFVTDARDGLNVGDHEIGARLRKQQVPVFVAVNKSEGRDADIVTAEFHDLGLGAPYGISAKRGSGIGVLFDKVIAALPAPDSAAAESEARRVAVLGRPNVGKSTLINRMVRTDRVVVSDQPGTTRDSVRIAYHRDGIDYELIDTAGIRRRSRVQAGIERFSVVRTLQAVDAAEVVIMVLDAQSGVEDQDARLAGLANQSGRSIVVAVNKWDLLSDRRRSEVRRQLQRKLPFLVSSEPVFISALHGSGLGDLFVAVDRAYVSAMVSMGTGLLNRRLQKAVAAVAPPTVSGQPVKLKFAHQGGKNPPLIVIHGNRVASIPTSYRRYLANYFRDAYDLFGTNVKIILKRGDNPYRS